MKGGRRPGAGRKKGVPNRLGSNLKEAILEAAERAGGQGGMVAYLQMQAAANPGPFLSILGKVLPLQVTGADGGALQVIVKRFAEGDD